MTEPAQPPERPLRAALDEFVAGWRQGDAPEIDAFCAEHAECGAELRQRIEDFVYVAEGFTQVEGVTEVDAPLTPAESPERFGHFRLLRCLGQGGMGTVHLAFDERLQREVALKQIRPECLASPQIRARFKREALAVSRLDHPNLCRVLDAGEEGDTPYLVMPYVAGDTLSSRIERARGDPAAGLMETSATAHLIEKVARGLHHAHESGVVHRDVKPANVMVKKDGEPVLLDFGLAREEEGEGLALTDSAQQLGTPFYMAPEQVAPRGRGADRRTDVYGLGVALYECLTLAPPFDAPTRHELFESILHAPTPNPRRANSAVSRDLSVVVETALQKEPHRRYQSALDFAEDLRRVRCHEPIRAKRVGSVVRAWRWSQRNPGAATALVVFAVALVVTIDLFWRARHNLAQFQVVANVVRLERAVQGLDELSPAWPHKVGAMESWLHDAEPLRQALPALSAQLDAMVAAANASGLSDAEQFLHDTLANLVSELEEFTADEGQMAGVAAALSWASVVEDLAVRRFRTEWAEARNAIATADGVVASELYREQPFDLVPQMGLVPIGMNPVTGLWEFYHLRSAWDPKSGADVAVLPIPTHDTEGSIEVKGDTGIVFTLVPGGTFTMGAQSTDPKAPNYDPDADSSETPHEVVLGPFFMARHELTQGQWMRLSGGAEPSTYKPAMDRLPVPVTLAHPVETVTWTMCRDLVRQHGLVLPTESQWEYACRAGTSTPWSFGDRVEDLAGAANLWDQAAEENSRQRAKGQVTGVKGRYAPFHDGYVTHSPVGVFKANGFGLFDMHGNIWEWCRDKIGAYSNPASPGDGERRMPDSSPHASNPDYPRVQRGGTFSGSARAARAALRQKSRPSVPNFYVGMRAARALWPTESSDR